jgi:hypothetical protein
VDVVFVRLVQCGAIAFHPGVRFHLFAYFSNADAQVRGNFLPREQPPERQ